MNPLKEIQKAALSGLAKAPGWVPLLILVHWLLEQLGIPSRIGVLGWSINLPSLTPEIWAGLLTAAAYLLGDQLDEWFFKKRIPTGRGDEHVSCQRWNPQRVEKARALGRQAMRVNGDSYRYAMALARAAGVHWCPVILNESAKFLRSLVIPLAILPFWLGRPTLVSIALPLVLALATFLVYVGTKLEHLRQLYLRVAVVVRNPRFTAVNCGSQRLAFWKGQLVTSIDPRMEDPCAGLRDAA